MRWFQLGNPLGRLEKALVRLEACHAEAMAAAPSGLTARARSAALADVARCRKTVEVWGVSEELVTRIWRAVEPLVACPIHEEAMRGATLALLQCVLKNQSNRLAPAVASAILATLARLASSLATPHLECLVELLSLLTRGGTWLAGASGVLCADDDAAAVARCVAGWLQLLPSDDDDDHAGKKKKADAAELKLRDATEAARPLLLRLLNALVRNNLLLLCSPPTGGDGGGIVGQIVGAVCTMCEDMVLWRAARSSARSSAHASAAENHILTFCVLEACVSARNTSLRGGVSLVSTLPLVVRAICFAIGVEFEPLWTAMRSLLRGSVAHLAMCALIDILDSPAQRAALLSSAASSTEATASASASASSRPTLSPPPPPPPSERQVLLLRGAVFIVSMSCWGSARVESLEFRFASVLPSLRNSLAIGSEVVAFEVVLSLQRLIRKYGDSMCGEWPSVIGILSDAIDLVSAADAGTTHASAAPAGAGGASSSLEGAGAAGASSSATNAGASRAERTTSTNGGGNGSSSGAAPQDRRVRALSTDQRARHRRHSSSDALSTKLDEFGVEESGSAAKGRSTSTSTSTAAESAASMTPTRREETTDLETEVVAALYLIEELHRSGSYAGSVDDLRTLQQRVKHRLPTKLVLTLLRWRATNLHPTYGSGVKEWLFRLDAILTDFLDVRNETREKVRADAFELLHEAHWFARYDAEAVNALIDRVLIPRIQSIDATRDAGLHLRAITMVTEVARQLHEQAGSIFLSGVVDADTPRAAVLLAGQLSERFDALVAMLESALRSANATSQHIAATKLTSLFLSSLTRPPGRHTVRLYRVLVQAMANHESKEVRATVLQCLASLRADRHYRIVHVGETNVRVSTVVFVERGSKTSVSSSSSHTRSAGSVEISIELLVAALVQRLHLETDHALLLREIALLSVLLQSMHMVAGLSEMVKRVLLSAVSGCLAVWSRTSIDETDDAAASSAGSRFGALAWATRAMSRLVKPSEHHEKGKGAESHSDHLVAPLSLLRSGKKMRARVAVALQDMPVENASATLQAAPAVRLRVLAALGEVAAGLLALVKEHAEDGKCKDPDDVGGGRNESAKDARSEKGSDEAAGGGGEEEMAVDEKEDDVGGDGDGGSNTKAPSTLNDWMVVLLAAVLSASESLPALGTAPGADGLMVECCTTFLRVISIALHTVPRVAFDYMSEIILVVCAAWSFSERDERRTEHALECIAIGWLRGLPRASEALGQNSTLTPRDFTTALDAVMRFVGDLVARTVSDEAEAGAVRAVLPNADMMLRMVLSYDAALAWYLCCPVQARMKHAMRLLPILFVHRKVLSEVAELSAQRKMEERVKTNQSAVKTKFPPMASVAPSEAVKWATHLVAALEDLFIRFAETDGRSSDISQSSSSVEAKATGGGTTLAFVDALVTTEPIANARDQIHVTVRRATGTARWSLGLSANAISMNGAYGCESESETLSSKPMLMSHASTMVQLLSLSSLRGGLGVEGTAAPLAPRLVPESTALRRALALLDQSQCHETHKVGVLYCRSGNTLDVPRWSTSKDTSVCDMLLLLEHGSPAYAAFLLDLGTLAPLVPGSAAPASTGGPPLPPAPPAVAAAAQAEGTPRSEAQLEAWNRMRREGQYWGGLDPRGGTDGKWALLWEDKMKCLRVAFHVATLMPLGLSDDVPASSSSFSGGGGERGGEKGVEGAAADETSGALPLERQLQPQIGSLRARSNSAFQQSVVRKKRHIGNDNVLVIFDDDEGEFSAADIWVSNAPGLGSGSGGHTLRRHKRNSSGSLSALEEVGSLSSDTNLVHIIVSPAGPAHLRVRVRAHASVPPFGPLCAGSDTILPSSRSSSSSSSSSSSNSIPSVSVVANLVRRTAINADTSCCVKLRKMGAVASWQARLQQIERVHHHLSKKGPAVATSGGTTLASASAAEKSAGEQGGAGELVDLLLRAAGRGGQGVAASTSSSGR